MVCVIKTLTGGTKLRDQAAAVLKLVLFIAIGAVIVNAAKHTELPDLSAFDVSSQDNVSELYDREMSRQISENIASVLLSQLEAAGISTSDIEVYVNISEDGSISINKVVIAADDTVGAAAVIRRSLGEETEVVNGDS